LGVLSGALAALCLTSSAEAATFAPCKVPAKGRTCGQLTVPLDRSGAVPGSVKLRIERQKAKRSLRPPLLIVAGGPGESSTAWYDAELTKRVLGTEARSRDVVVMDLRGTGRSSVLRCADLERAGRDDRAAAAAACAAALGTSRGFYTARDTAEDIEAVRVALGVPRIALLGQAYGSRVVLEYTRRHPESVERIVLSSPVGPAGLDPLGLSGFAALPRVLGNLCPKGACRLSTRDLVADTTRLVRRLANRPLRGVVFDGRGRRRVATVGPRELYAVLNVDNGLGLGEFPGLVRNALRGDAVPILRTLERADIHDALTFGPRLASPAAMAASLCEESTFPWSRTAPLGNRDGEARAFTSGQSTSVFAPFGPAVALGSETLDLCRLWPTASAPSEPISSLPAIPTLIVASEQDLRWTVEDAEAIARLIPGAHLMRHRSGFQGFAGLVVDDCSQRATRRFLAGGRPGACQRLRSYMPVPKPLPMTLREIAPAVAPGRAGRTFAAVRMTFADGAANIALRLVERLAEASREGREGRSVGEVLRPTVRAGGMRGGWLALDFKSDRLRFERISYVPGVSLSGSVSNLFKGSSRGLRGMLRVSGDKAARGRLTVRGDTVHGKLGGRPVRGRLHAPYASFSDNGEGAFFIRPAASAAGPLR
jgi:pimeloyl-ACP methyl ester carboxylesterase